MIIACPKCSRRFGVQDELVPASGRRARCASCGEVFIAVPAETTDADSPIHFERLPQPGDGLATSSSFVAPAAPPAVLAKRRGGGYPVPGLPSGGRPVLVSPQEERSEPDRTVALPAEAVSQFRRSEPAAASAAEPGSSRWIVRDELGRPVACDRRELVRMIRAGLLLPSDRVKEEGTGRETVANEIQDLSFYFALRASTPERKGPPGPAASRTTERSRPDEPAPAAPPRPSPALKTGAELSPAARQDRSGWILVLVSATATAALWVLPAGIPPALPFAVGAASGGCLASALWIAVGSRRRRKATSPAR